MGDASDRRAVLLDRSLLLLLLAVLIVLWGLGAVYGTLAATGRWERFLGRQALWAAGAFAVLPAVWRTPFRTLLRCAPAAGAVSLALLLLLPWFGSRVNGMAGWYECGNVTVQPSELCKGFFLLLLVRVLAGKEQSEWRRFLLAALAIALFCFLILLQPDWGTAFVYALGGLGALYFGGVKKRFLVLFGAVGALGMAAAVSVHPYMLRRVAAFLDPRLDPGGAGWHQHQFAIAAARGEWVGVKNEMAAWSTGFLPLSHNDSIYAAMTEMLGLLGAGLLLFLFAVWFFQWFRLAGECAGPARRHCIEASAAMVLAQTLLHIAVNLALVPPTGITLPLVSYGGSSMFGTMLMLAISLSAAREERLSLPAAVSSR